MKRLISSLLLCLLLIGCAGEAAPTEPPATEPELLLPEELFGVWVSASAGDLNMTETISFYESGEFSVNSTYQGQDRGTIFGTYGVLGHTLYCDITAGADPYQVIYEYRIDGRELILEDDDGPAHYLRTS